MSDEHIDISVETSEIDHAIARLDEALAKKEQLTGQTIPQTEASTSVRSVAKQPVPKLGVFYGGIGDLGRQTEAVKQQATNLLTNEAPKIKGLEQSAKRIANMLPGLREANRLQTNLKTLSAGNIVGAVGLFMLAIQIYHKIDQYYKKLEQEKQDYQRQIMETSKFTTAAQFKDWETNQRQIIDNYIKNGVIL